jgi:hypothetical protein
VPYICDGTSLFLHTNAIIPAPSRKPTFWPL